MSCSDVRSLIGGYVLHALQPHEAESVRRHLATCPDCAREHAELAPLPALLDVPLDPEAAPAQPPASLEEAVLDRFAAEAGARRQALAAGARDEALAASAGKDAADPAARDERLTLAAPAHDARRPRRAGRVRRWAGRPLPAAALGAFLAAALTFGITRALDGGDGASTHKTYGAHLRAVAGGAPGHGTVPAPADRPYAYAKLSTSESGTQVKLEASGLGGAPGAVYELWCVYPDGSKVSAGTFRADATGRAEASMTTAARVGDYHRLSVERRVPGRDGERVLAGDIAY